MKPHCKDSRAVCPSLHEVLVDSMVLSVLYDLTHVTCHHPVMGVLMTAPF